MTESAAPFLKWAGGKRQLLPQLRRFYPAVFDRYIEAFLGSGALFFDLCAEGRLRGKETVLIDSNADLIACYAAIRDDVDAVIDVLRVLEREHQTGRERFYYEVRDGRFNPSREQALVGRAEARYTADLAAMLIYLNRTCFNGLFRLNSRGAFNVPVGRYANPRICDEPNLRAVSRALNGPHIRLNQGSFESVQQAAGPGTFVYFDPPYAPVSDTAHFRSYTADGFSADQQAKLQEVMIELAERDVAVLLSNSVAPLIVELYDGNPKAARAGLKAHRVPARRAINCDGSARGVVDEYLVTNVQPARGSTLEFV